MSPDGDAKAALAAACDSLLEEPGMRFAGVVNRMGRLVVGRFREGVKSHLDDKEDGMAYMEFAMEVFLRTEFDDKLGAVEYVLSKRKKINVISIPVGGHVVLVSTEPGADVEGIVGRAGAAFAAARPGMPPHGGMGA